MICGCDTPEDQNIHVNNFTEPKKVMTDNNEPIEFKVVAHLCFDTFHLDFYKTEVEYVVNELNKHFAGNSRHFFRANTYTFLKHRDTFLKYNALSADANLQFVLERIVHVPTPEQTSVNVVTLDKRIKNQSLAKSPLNTLNIWIADIPIHGYAKYPWQLKEESKYDGVVISKNVFGRFATNRFSLGKVLTHMVGHWLGLLHTFDNDVLIKDVPEQDSPTYGDPLQNTKSWPGDLALHMYMNFMDFTDDHSSYMFTKSQVQKMRAAVYLYRRELVNLPAPKPDPVTPAPVVKSQPERKPVLREIWEFHFEKDDISQWKKIPRINQMDAKIERRKEPGMFLKRHAAAEIPLDMSETASATITFSIKDSNSNTTIFFETNDQLWQRTRVKNKTNDWEEYTIPMPKPFGPNYKLRFQASNNNKYTIIDNIVIKKSN
jgi:hypothetical protein